MTTSIKGQQAKGLVDEHYKKVAKRWQERVTDGAFMQQLRSGKLPEKALKIFFRNWGSYTIEINTLEAASYHKHISFFRKHRDLMGPMAAKLADELIHPKPPGHVHVVVETAKALDISEDEIFLAPMLAEFRAKLDFKRSILWEGTVAEFYAAGATEEQTGYWSAGFFQGADHTLWDDTRAGDLFLDSRRGRSRGARRRYGPRQFSTSGSAAAFRRRNGDGTARLQSGILRLDRCRPACSLPASRSG
ncbi:MAG: hypothetical protein ACREQV_18520 [Candidatus Binatia bacterium]